MTNSNPNPNLLASLVVARMVATCAAGGLLLALLGAAPASAGGVSLKCDLTAVAPPSQQQLASAAAARPALITLPVKVELDLELGLAGRGVVVPDVCRVATNHSESVLTFADLTGAR